MVIVNLITTLDQIQIMMMVLMMMMMVMMMMMPWTCQEYRTRGKHMIQVLHQHRFLILMFQLKKLLIPGQDDDPSPGPDPTSEPIRVQRKQRQISVDSTDALPKAKAKVIIKKPKVQLPGG